jgi:hypothetical protein
MRPFNSSMRTATFTNVRRIVSKVAPRQRERFGAACGQALVGREWNAPPTGKRAIRNAGFELVDQELTHALL